MNKAFRVGITGGIGAGKSLVCDIFFHLGVPVYRADERAKWLMANSTILREEMISKFGPKTFDGQKLNRNYLAAHVFNNQEKLNLLNGIVHPFVDEDFSKWFVSIEYLYCIKEAALLFETGSYEELDLNILVYAPENIRIQRVIKRDPFRSEDEIKAIIGKQMDEEQKKKLADLILINDGKSMILPEVLKIHSVLINSLFSGNP